METLSIISTYHNNASLQSLCDRKLCLDSEVDLFTVNKVKAKNRFNPAGFSKIAETGLIVSDALAHSKEITNRCYGNKKAVSIQGVSFRFTSSCLATATEPANGDTQLTR